MIPLGANTKDLFISKNKSNTFIFWNRFFKNYIFTHFLIQSAILYIKNITA